MRTTTRAQFDAYDRNYNEHVNNALSFSGVKVDALLELLTTSASSTSTLSLIDIGCGIANSHPLLAGRISRLVGVDVSSTCVAAAAAANPQNEYATFNGLELPYRAATFDAASAVCVFH